jgi:hypothetical protein
MNIGKICPCYFLGDEDAICGTGAGFAEGPELRRNRPPRAGDDAEVFAGDSNSKFGKFLI